MRFLLLIIYVVTINLSFAQTPVKSFRQLSCPEKWWVLTHPFIAKKAKKITSDAIRISDEMKRDSLLDGNSNGGQLDAFRHAYWMASLSQKIKMRKALSLGRAHEKGNYKMFKKGKVDEEKSLPDSISGAMDLFNNEIGAQMGFQNRMLDQDSLKILIRKNIVDGKMKIISMNKDGQFLDCNGQVININNFQHTWAIPKCLVNSVVGNRVSGIE